MDYYRILVAVCNPYYSCFVISYFRIRIVFIVQSFLLCFYDLFRKNYLLVFGYFHASARVFSAD